MIELLSIGDKLAPGEYRLHSRFSRAVNFESRNCLASIVDENIGPGPLNIVARGIDLNTVQTLLIDDHYLILDDCRLDFDDDKLFISELDLHLEIDHDRFYLNLDAFENALIHYSPHKSLAFLLDPKRESEFKTSFETEFVKRMEGGVDSLFNGDIVSGVKMIKGLGFGLTPSGDDFVAGMLVAYRILERLFNKDYSSVRNEIYTATVVRAVRTPRLIAGCRVQVPKTENTTAGNNLFTNMFLRCTWDGSIPARQKDLVNSLLYSGENDILECTHSLMEIGETSGADWGVGLAMTLKKVCKV